MRFAALVGVFAACFAQDNTQVTSGNPIDTILEAKWKELSLRPNKLAGDEEFLRRVTVDLIGTIPEPAEALSFAKSNDAKKREKKIDELLASADWADYWAERFAEILLGVRDKKKQGALEPIREFMHEKLSKNERYDSVVEELLTAKGTNKDASKANAFLFAYLYKDKSQKKDIAVQVAKVFMGIQFQCAQCHDHPFEKWTKDDFFSVVANFASTQLKVIDKGDPKDKKDDTLEIVDRRGKGGYRPEGYKVDVKPKFIDGQPISGDNLRETFARRLIGSDNPQFARATVNRIWSIFTGQGFVEPVDDFSIKNQPTIPDLLDALSKGFVDNKYDIKWLMKTIATSRAYQLSSHRRETDYKPEVQKYYVYAIVRPMNPDQLFGALLRAQGFDEGSGKIGKAKQQFMREAGAGSDSPGEYSANVQQIMRMLNMDSPIYRGTKAQGRGRLTQILKETKKPEDVFTRLYLATVSRAPTHAELAHCLKYFEEHKEATSAYEDIFFVLLNTNEFYFNH